MERPTWGSVIGVVFILAGLFGLSRSFKQIKAQDLLDLVHSELSNYTKSENNEVDIDTADLKVLSFFTDSITLDSSGKIDVNATVTAMTNISDYRMAWMRKLGYIGILFGMLLLVCGILFFKRTKFTIPIALTTLAFCICLALFKLFIYAKDTESSKMFSWGENISQYFGVFFYILILMIVMVMDKSYYQQSNLGTDDFYDKS